MAAGREVVLNLQPVSDGHPGIVPRITAPDAVLISDEEGASVAWMLLSELTQGPTGATGPTGAAGADGLPSAPADPGDNGRVPVASDGDLSYSANLTYSGGLLQFTGTALANLDGIGSGNGSAYRAINNTAATVIAPVQCSPSVEFVGSAWDTDGSFSASAVMYLQLVPVAGATPSWSLVCWGNEAADEMVFRASPGAFDLPNLGLLRGVDFAGTGAIPIAWVDDNDHVRIGSGLIVYDPNTNFRHYDGGAPIAKPSGVAANAAAIIAALVSIGIFDA